MIPKPPESGLKSDFCFPHPCVARKSVNERKRVEPIGVFIGFTRAQSISGSPLSLPTSGRSGRSFFGFSAFLAVKFPRGETVALISTPPSRFDASRFDALTPHFS